MAEVVAKFDGKQGNKRFADALRGVPGVSVEEYHYNSKRMRYEIHYSGPVWYELQAGDTRPAPFFSRGLSVGYIELDGPNKTDRVDAESLFSWCSRYEQDAREFRAVAGNCSPAVDKFNAALDALQEAYDELPVSIMTLYNVDNPRWRFCEIGCKR